MNFLNNLGPWELTVILILAILLVGPKRVLQIIQSIREFAGKVRAMSGEFTSLLRNEIQGPGQEAEQVGQAAGQDLKRTVQEALNPIAAVQAELQAAARDTRKALESAVKDEALSGVQSEMQAAVQETRQALETPVETPKEEPPIS